MSEKGLHYLAELKSLLCVTGSAWVGEVTQ